MVGFADHNQISIRRFATGEYFRIGMSNADFTSYAEPLLLNFTQGICHEFFSIAAQGLRRNDGHHHQSRVATLRNTRCGTDYFLTMFIGLRCNQNVP